MSPKEIEDLIEDINPSDGNNGDYEIFRGAANQIHANEVTIRQGGANDIQASQVSIIQGGAVKVTADALEVTSGGVVFARTEEATFNNSSARVVTAGGHAQLNNSQSVLVVAGNGADLVQTGTVVLISPKVTLDKASGVVFLVAKEVHGDVNTAFGPRDSILFGLVAGISAAIVSMLVRLASRKKKK